MFLKSHKMLPFLSCIFAAFLLASGVAFSGEGGRNTDGSTQDTFSVYAEDAVSSTEFAVPPYGEEEAVSSTEFAVPPYEESEAESETESEIQGMEGKISERKIPSFFGFILLAAGGILTVVILLLMRQEGPGPGPEIEVSVLFLSIVLIFQPLSGGMLFRLGHLWLSFFLLLISVRGLWSWMWKKFPPGWSAGHRLGVWLVGATGQQSRYLVCQFVWTIAALTGSFLLIVFVQQEVLKVLVGVSGLAAVILPVYCFIKLARDVDHLSEQIRRLHEGESVSAGTGVFADVEKKLIDLNRQRDEAIQAAVTSERFKVDLISNVSHDLRTPLTAILGYGELLKEEHLSSIGEKQLEELNRKAGYMRELVESLFELTKVSSGVVESKKEEIDLIRLLEQTIGLFDDQLKANKLQIRRRYKSDSVLLVTDGARMHQVFANLIGNAIKYTLQGTRIHLEVKDGGREYIVRIVNIASYEMDFDAAEILQRFVRGDKARTTKGSGLGLAIAQTYTESVGGTFQVLVDGEQFSAIVALPKN